MLLATFVAAFSQAGLILALVILTARAERERARLMNLLAARTPQDFAVLQRASSDPVRRAASESDPEGPSRHPVGLS